MSLTEVEVAADYRDWTMRDVALDGTTLDWRGAVDVVDQRGDALQPLRFASADRDLLHDGVMAVGSIPAGVRLVFATDSQLVLIELESLAGGPRPTDNPFDRLDGPATVDVSVHGTVVSSQAVPATGRVELHTGLTEVADVEVWLPHRCPVAVKRVAVADEARVEAPRMQRRIWLAHGSSITQSRFSTTPARSWTATVARSLGLDLLNLGYAGECHLDPVVASMIARQPADVLSICAGINAHTSISMSERVYRASLIGFLTAVREGHPGTPMLVSSAVACPGRERTPSHPRVLPARPRRWLHSQRRRLPEGAIGPTLQELRDATADVVRILQDAGDGALHFVDGRDVFSAGDAEHLVDGLHPDQRGEDLIAERMTAILRRQLDSNRSDQ